MLIDNFVEERFRQFLELVAEIRNFDRIKLVLAFEELVASVNFVAMRVTGMRGILTMVLRSK